jgi:hypothetical protein
MIVGITGQGVSACRRILTDQYLWGQFVPEVLCDLGGALPDFVGRTPDLFGHYAQSLRERLDVVLFTDIDLSPVVNVSLNLMIRHGAPSLVMWAAPVTFNASPLPILLMDRIRTKAGVNERPHGTVHAALWDHRPEDGRIARLIPFRVAKQGEQDQQYLPDRGYFVSQLHDSQKLVWECFIELVA